MRHKLGFPGEGYPGHYFDASVKRAGFGLFRHPVREQSSGAGGGSHRQLDLHRHFIACLADLATDQVGVSINGERPAGEESLHLIAAFLCQE